MAKEYERVQIEIDKLIGNIGAKYTADLISDINQNPKKCKIVIYNKVADAIIRAAMMACKITKTKDFATCTSCRNHKKVALYHIKLNTKLSFRAIAPKLGYKSSNIATYFNEIENIIKKPEYNPALHTAYTEVTSNLHNIYDTQNF